MALPFRSTRPPKKALLREPLCGLLDGYESQALINSFSIYCLIYLLLEKIKFKPIIDFELGDLNFTLI